MKKVPIPFVAGAAALLLIAGLLGWSRWSAHDLAKRRAECKALATALDKTVRAKSFRVFERIVENRWDVSSERCLAALEYHYKPCDEKTAKKAPLVCGGPDADIAIYAFADGGAKPLLMCERYYQTGEAQCTESVYGVDGSLLSSRDVPPDQFPRLKDGMMGTKSQ